MPTASVLRTRCLSKQFCERDEPVQTNYNATNQNAEKTVEDTACVTETKENEGIENLQKTLPAGALLLCDAVKVHNKELPNKRFAVTAVFDADNLSHVFEEHARARRRQYQQVFL